MSEQREILRRIAERGLTLAQKGSESEVLTRDQWNLDKPALVQAAHDEHLDLWQHMLDEIARLPVSEKQPGHV